MGTIVLHPGTPKAGSTSIQTWLTRNAERLRESGINLLVVRVEGREGEAARLELTEYGGESVEWNAILKVYEAEAAEKQVLLESFFEHLDAAATRARVTVVSSETLGVFFWQADRMFLSGLEELAAGHEVRIAYYVRPQHSALEASWRQWGFRRGHSPSRFLALHSESFHYYETLLAARQHAPSASFELRPFRRDLLDLGHPAADFARRFLDIADPAPEDSSIWSNRGLPLEVVNALRHAPPGAFWSSEHDNRKLDLFKDILADVTASETDETVRSRLVLQAYSHATFEAGNQRLIDAMGWETDSFVPAVTGEQPDLTAMDALWEPRASEAELEALYLALERAVSPVFDNTAASRLPDDSAKYELAGAIGVMDATARDLARAQAELSQLRSSRSWRLTRRLGTLRGHDDGTSDPAAGVSERLARAAGRIEHFETSVDLDEATETDG